MSPARFVAAALLAMATASQAIADPSSPPAQSMAEPTYRTMCVRTCDGFYFPIHAYAAQSSLADDAKACRAGCSSDAELYYFPTFGGAVATMVNFKGQSYAEHPKAFAFRKAIAPGCTCSPPAWSAEAKARHAEYARLEEIELEKDRAFVAARTAAEAAIKRAAEAAIKSAAGAAIKIAAEAAARTAPATPALEPQKAPATDMASAESADAEPAPVELRPPDSVSTVGGEADYDFTTMRRPQRSIRILQHRAYARPPRDIFAAH